MHAGGRICNLAYRVDAGQGSIRRTAGAPGREWERYSTEVQQLTRTRGDLRGRGRTVTCGDGRGWTCCRQMACKRPAVRARLAPLVRSEIRTNRTGSTAGKYSNGGPGAAVPVFDRTRSPGWGCWQDAGFQALNRRWPACHLGKSPPHRSGDSCHLATTQPPWKAIPANDSCCIGKWPRSRWASRPVRFTPGNRASGPGWRVRLTAGAARGLSALRRWCQPGTGPAGALRHSGAGVAPWRSSLRAAARWCIT